MKNSIVRNLSWILICSILAKFLGGVYRIVLTRILGTNIGLYQMVFSAYSFLVILISSGIPLSVSKLVASKKNEKSKQKIIYGAIAILFTISGILALVLTLGSRGLALLQGEGQISLCYIILAPSLLFSSGVAVFKGYYQGSHEFKISALSGIFEQVSRVVVGLVLMLMLRKWCLLGTLLGAVIGTVVGDVVAFAFLLFCSKNKFKFKYSIRYLNEGKRVFKFAYPIMLYSLIVPFVNFIDSFLVVKLLGLNLSNQTATLLYGLQSGVVGSVISIPSIFSFSLVSVLMPSLSEDYSKRKFIQFNQKANMAFKLTFFVALPCAVFFGVNASNIINLLYGSGINGFGVNGQYVARNLLIISSISVVFSSLNQVSVVILQSLNNKFLPIVNLSVGMGCKILLELMFVPSKYFGIYAYSIASVVGFVVAGVLNMYAVERYLNDMFDIKYIIKQFALVTMVLGLLVIFKLFNSIWFFILGSLFTVIVYLVAVYLIKLFSKQDINSLINTE